MMDTLDNPTDDVRAALDTVKAAEPVTPVTPEPVTPEPQTDSAKATDAAKADAARARDDKGRFSQKKDEPEVKPKNGAVKPEEQEAAPGVVKEEPKPEVQAKDKPPASWGAAAREKWQALPPEARAEVMKRERETSVVLEQSAQARKTLEQVNKVLAPHAQMFQADNVHPLQAMESAMRVMGVLRTGNPSAKAAMAAQVVKAMGVDIAMLDAALAGEAPKQTGPAEYRDPRVDQLMGALQQQAQARQQSVIQNAHTEVDKFAESHEFLSDENVRQDMADLMDGAARRGVELSMEEAYIRACRARPDVWEVMQQREAAKAAATSNTATQRARAASSSVKSQPAPGAQPQASGNHVDDVRAAIARLSK
jgi:hypothetical protein